MFTDDPIADFNRHDIEQAEQLEQLPTCCDCGEYIQEEEAYYINDEWICEDCMGQYRRAVHPEW